MLIGRLIVRMYKINVGGENFLIHIEGKKRRVNFVRSYYIDIASLESAEFEAMAKLKAELCSIVLNEKNDPPEMYIQSIESVKTMPSNSPVEFYWNEIDEQK